MDPFDGREYVEFETHEGQIVSLHREQWRRKVERRDILSYNYPKIGKTLAEPDIVRRSTKSADTLLYYKHFPTVYRSEKVEVPNRHPYFVVVVGQGQRIITMYFADRVKDGDQVWPEKS